MAKTTSAGTQTTLLTDETFTAAPGAPVSITITGGTIDGVSAGVTTPLTQLCVDNLCIDGSIISSVIGNIYLTPLAGSNITLDGATTIDGGVIANTGTFTNTGNVTVTGTQTITGDLQVDNLSLNGNTISSLSGDIQLKAISGSNLTLQDDQSATKEVSLDMSIVPQGTDRKWRFPTGFNIMEHFVGETENQFLDHKILNRPVIDQGFLRLPQISGIFSKNSYQIQPSDITGDRVAKLPKLTSNDEFVFSKQTQTLTNKTLTTPVINTGASLKNAATSAGYLDFYEDSDNGTNYVRVIGPASTTTVTITLPAATDTLVGKATTDTLTNKTLTSPTITSPIIGGTWTPYTTSTGKALVMGF